MLDPALRRKIRRLRLWARQRVQADLRGSYQSVYAGSGLEFDDFRAYIPGDEVKHIDWKVTARQNRAHVRVYREERDVVFHILLDVSSSLFFGSRAGRQKIDVALELVALIAALTEVHQDRSSLALFAHKVIEMLPPRRGESHIHAMLQKILMLPRQGCSTAMAAALREVTPRFTRKSVVILISDFLDDHPYLPELKKLSSRHMVRCVRIYDPLEVHPPRATGLPLWRDVESGITQALHLTPLELTSHAHGGSGGEKWLRDIRRAGGDGVVMSTADDSFQTLLRMRQRRSRWARR